MLQSTLRLGVHGLIVIAHPPERVFRFGLDDGVGVGPVDFCCMVAGNMSQDSHVSVARFHQPVVVREGRADRHAAGAD